MINIELTWSEFKNIVSAKGLQMQYVSYTGVYYVFAIETQIHYFHNILKTVPAGSDETDFVNNYLSSCNNNIITKTEEEPAVVAGSTPVNVGTIVLPIKNGGSSNTTYTITNTKRLIIKTFSGGSQALVTGGAGGKVEIYYDPNGTGVGMTLIQVAYVNASNFEFTISKEYIGNGTRRILLRSTNWSTVTGVEFAHYFIGYEEDVV